LDYFIFIPESRRADKCIKCQRCVQFCPQKIDIPAELAKIHYEAISLSIGVDVDELIKMLADDGKLICFGAGTVGKNTVALLRECGVSVDFFCDNNESAWGTVVDGVPVISFSQLQELHLHNRVCVLISSIYKSEIREQLDEYGIKEAGGS